MSGGGLVTEQYWDRHGACDSTACRSACCKFLRLQVPPTYASDPDVRNWIELHGLHVQQISGATFVNVPKPCLALGEQGECTLYGKPERPQVCASYPATPDALNGILECGFSFTERKETTNGLRRQEVSAPDEGAGRADGRPASPGDHHEARADAQKVGAR